MSRLEQVEGGTFFGTRCICYLNSNDVTHKNTSTVQLRKRRKKKQDENIMSASYAGRP